MKAKQEVTEVVLVKKLQKSTFLHKNESENATHIIDYRLLWKPVDCIADCQVSVTMESQTYLILLMHRLFLAVRS